ncbi:hypothetical protein DPEC_G00321270 [Dallia pectoralis]|uniref:Uncharacterized protein n=1 Tax=Dallia pectoralis TaxID=75939 RepID=A0ACC2FA38_DALPE|nr:hypothetical protein DPEC_G00321270 [Dallia pectoralis]
MSLLRTACDLADDKQTTTRTPDDPGNNNNRFIQSYGSLWNGPTVDTYQHPRSPRVHPGVHPRHGTTLWGCEL